MNKAITWQKVFVIGEVYGMVDIREGNKAKEPDDEGNASKQIGPVKIVPAAIKDFIRRCRRIRRS